MLELMCLYIPVHLNYLHHGRCPPFNVTSFWAQQHINLELIPRKIADIYVGIICIFHKGIDYILSEFKSQHYILAFHNK